MVCVKWVAVVATCFLPATATAQLLAFVPNPQDDVSVRFKNDPKVCGLAVEVTALRGRMMRWHERDFRTLFGKPFAAGAKDYALMCSEPRILTLSGIRIEGAEDKTHTASYRIGDGARVDVYFQRDGETPSYAIFYLKVDDTFVRLERADQLEARVTWERVRLWRAVRHIDDRWRDVVGWEVDPVGAAKRLRGFDSPDPEEKLKAAIEWAEKKKLRLEYTRTGPPGDTCRKWFLDDTLLAEVQCRGRGTGAEKPYTFTFYRPDGSVIRDEQVGPGCYTMARWYRPDGSAIRAESVAMLEGGGSWKEASWDWQNKAKTGGRSERDTNGDGIPDEVAQWADGKPSSRQSLAVEKSWAVHPELIPADQFPDQPDRRLSVRKIAK